MTCRAILWDMDGTLLDSEPAHEAAFHDALHELGLSVPPGFHDALLGSSADRVHARLVAATGSALTLAGWRALKWRHFQRHAGRIAPRAGMAGLARAQAARGVPMAVVSNSTAAEVGLCLGAARLAPLFATTVSRADVAAGKPAPDGYLLAAARLGLPPAACLVIEDSPLGACAGLAAAMRVIIHPQHPAPATTIPAGAHYIAPDAPLAPVLRAALGQ